MVLLCVIVIMLLLLLCARTGLGLLPTISDVILVTVIVLNVNVVNVIVMLLVLAYFCCQKSWMLLLLLLLLCYWYNIDVILKNISNPPRYGEHLQSDRHICLSLGHLQRKGDKIEVISFQQSDKKFCCRHP